MLDATTLPQIAAAWQALRDWIARRPEDSGMRDAFEQLAMMQEIAEAEAAGTLSRPSTDERKAA